MTKDKNFRSVRPTRHVIRSQTWTDGLTARLIHKFKATQRVMEMAMLSVPRRDCISIKVICKVNNYYPLKSTLAYLYKKFEGCIRFFKGHINPEIVEVKIVIYSTILKFTEKCLK